MPMSKDLLKTTIKGYMTSVVVPMIIGPDGKAIPDPNPANAVTVSPSEAMLNAMTEIVTHIQMNSQVTGNFNLAASGGMAAGAGGGVPGPVTASLTGVPVTGLGTVSGTVPGTGAVQ